LRILILGSSGLLGSTLSPTFVARGIEVFLHTRESGAPFYADLTDPNQTAALLQRSSPTGVLNLAGFTDVDQCEESPNKAFLKNVRIVENIVNAIVHSKRKIRLIQVSTDQLYSEPYPSMESEATPLNAYSLSKYMGEWVAQRIPATIIRTNFFGMSGAYTKASFSDWIVSKLRAETQFVGFNDVFFNPLQMDTLSRIILEMFDVCFDGVVNVGSRHGFSKEKFARKVAEQMQLPTKNVTSGSIDDANLKARRPKDMRMNVTLIESLLKRAMPTLETEIVKACTTYEKMLSDN
jgi:dTDP-4-dehydrorhamnose reductase